MIKTIEIKEAETSSIQQDEYTVHTALPEFTPATLDVARRYGTQKQRLKPSSPAWWGFILF